MGEAIVARASIGSASGGSGYVFMTEIITEDKVWVAPDAQNQQFSVRIFGGGGAGITGGASRGAGGGSGWMNNSIITIPVGTLISIAIGHGGAGSGGQGTGGNGGTTAFGGFLSANGGGCAQFRWSAGNGGAGGGARGSDGNGGLGYQFGGGGGGYGRGGDGTVSLAAGTDVCNGKYGGGGGGGWYYNNTGYIVGGAGGDGICIIQYYKAIQQNSFVMYQ